MKKIALLGDSIRQIGYGKRVPELLGEEYSVFQPAENCRFAKHTFRGIFDWRPQLEGSDVIHWNNGLWDTCHLFDDGNFTPIDEYVETMKRIARILLRYSKRVIFATTTPAKPGHANQRNDEIDAYNAAVVPELQKMGIIINDLNSLVKPKIGEYICSDMLHLSPEGIEACAERVAEYVRAAAESI